MIRLTRNTFTGFLFLLKLNVKWDYPRLELIWYKLKDNALIQTIVLINTDRRDVEREERGRVKKLMEKIEYMDGWTARLILTESSLLCWLFVFSWIWIFHSEYLYHYHHMTQCQVSHIWSHDITWWLNCYVWTSNLESICQTQSGHFLFFFWLHLFCSFWLIFKFKFWRSILKSIFVSKTLCSPFFSSLYSNFDAFLNLIV